MAASEFNVPFFTLVIGVMVLKRWVLQSGESTSLQHFPRSPWERVFEGQLDLARQLEYIHYQYVQVV